MIMVLIAVTMAMCFTASTSIAADSMGEDPNVKVLIENDQVRVFEAIRPLELKFRCMNTRLL